MTLEDKLLEQLVIRKGLHGGAMRSILESELFKSLPLNKKVAFIEKYSDSMAQRPSLALGGVAKATTAGALTGALGTYVAMSGNFTGKNLLVGAGLTGLIAGGTALSNAIRDRSNERKLAEAAATKNGVSVLVENEEFAGSKNRTPGIISDSPLFRNLIIGYSKTLNKDVLEGNK